MFEFSRCDRLDAQSLCGASHLTVASDVAARSVATCDFEYAIDGGEIWWVFSS